MLSVQPWRGLVLGSNAWLSLACRCVSSHLLQSARVKKCWQISSHGRCCNSHGIVTAGHLSPCGYHKVDVFGHRFYLHRLVALAFLGPPSDPRAWQVHHRDGNPSNNRLENLEYVTPSDNILYSCSRPTRGNPGHSKAKPVMWRAVGSPGWRTSASIKIAALETGVSTRSVSLSCFQRKPIKGHDFVYAHVAEDEHMPGEVWKQMRDPWSGDEVPGRMVSSYGRMQFKNGRVSLGHLTKQGYYVTTLASKSMYVHRLVASAFLGLPPTLQHIHVNHKDYDKGNNSVENLEYITPAENVRHSYANPAGRRPTSSNLKPVESRLNGSQAEWTWHPSISSAARACGASPGSVSRWAQNGRGSEKFEFRFAEDPSAQTRPGEEWRDVDVAAHLDERLHRKLSTWARSV